MKTLFLMALLATFSLTVMAQDNDWENGRIHLSVTSATGESQFAENLRNGTSISVKLYNGGLGFSVGGSKAVTYGTNGYTATPLACGVTRYISTMNTQEEELFFIFDDHTKFAPPCQDKMDSVSRLTITVIEKKNGKVSSAVSSSQETQSTNASPMGSYKGIAKIGASTMSVTAQFSIFSALQDGRLQPKIMASFSFSEDQAVSDSMVLTRIMLKNVAYDPVTQVLAGEIESDETTKGYVNCSWSNGTSLDCKWYSRKVIPMHLEKIQN